MFLRCPSGMTFVGKVYGRLRSKGTVNNSICAELLAVIKLWRTASYFSFAVAAIRAKLYLKLPEGDL
jgi:hypothetical protein